MSSKRKPNTKLYFTKVLALSGAQAVVSGHLVAEQDEPTATIVLRVGGGQWTLLGKIPDVVYSIARCSQDRQAAPRFGVLGREGYFAIFGAAGVESTDPIIRGHPAYLEGLACAGEVFFSCGAQRQVLRHTGQGWTPIDQGLFVPFEGTPSGFLLGIAARSSNELFVCGSKGFAARWNGQRWATIEIPTNMDLNSVICTNDGNTYFAGAAGGLFALRASGQVDHMLNGGVSNRTFYDVCEFKNDLYLAAGSELVRVRGDQHDLVPLPTAPGQDLSSIYSLSASDSLWCVGDGNVRQFDGVRWVIHDCPANN